MAGVEGQAMLSPVREWQAEAAGSESPLPRVPQDPARTKNGFCKQREGHPYKIFFLLLRPSGVLCGVPSHPAITAAAVLFSELPARSGASSGTGTALAPTAPGPGDGGSREKRTGPRRR
ncbi:MAG: hypothetical protein DMG54_07660 [Acidobacteria bacterium]|nr:MAG: hypothetical protein DMG54_07660 [Acidobacteriota bacterium]